MFVQCPIFVYLGLRSIRMLCEQAKIGEDGVLAEYLRCGVRRKEIPMNKLEKSHRQFLFKETVISIFAGAVINFGFGFFIFRSQDAIMLWGKGGLFFGLIPNIFMMTAGMTMGITLATRRRVLKGSAPAAPFHITDHAVLRFLPNSFFIRALILGVVALIVLLPLSTVLLNAFKDFPISFAELLIFNTFYGGLIGLFITPVIIMGAMADHGPVQ